jgi:hypothetical protein
MSMCCVCPTTATATKTNPPKKKQSGQMTGGIKGYSVCCVCATAPVATKTNPPKKNDGPSKRRDGFRVAANRRI